MGDFPFTMVGFDLDGTLVDTQGDLGVALNHALGLIGRPAIPLDRVEHLIGGGTRRMLTRALEETGGMLPGAEFAALYPEVIAHYEVNIAVHSRPYPGCLDALDALAELGCALSVVTNKPERLAAKLLDELGLFGRFAALIGGDTAAFPKPHADPIDEAIARCGGKGRFAMVGDSTFDIGAARAAGVPAVALSFGYNDVPIDELGADIVIDHYDELVGALRKL
jgi:phosphoglycolate phosphatase